MVLNNMKIGKPYIITEDKKPLSKGDIVWFSTKDNSLCALSTFGERRNKSRIVRNDMLDPRNDYAVIADTEHYIYGSCLLPRRV